MCSMFVCGASAGVVVRVCGSVLVFACASCALASVGAPVVGTLLIITVRTCIAWLVARPLALPVTWAASSRRLRRLGRHVGVAYTSLRYDATPAQSRALS